MQTLKSRRLGKGKKAISPVIATIILIAITIVIAVAVAGWVFGLFKSYSGGPAVQILASSSSCSAGTSPSCSIVVDNTGNNAVQVNTVLLNGATVTLSPGQVISAGAQGATISFTVPASITLSTGETVTVVLQLSNGATTQTTLVVS
jgi:flagellin-like protein